MRGCVGDIFPQRPLYKSVITNAIYAGFGDRRFPQLQKDEYDQIKVEISALTPPTPVASWRDIRIGIDGMVLSKADSRPCSCRRWRPSRVGTWRPR